METTLRPPNIRELPIVGGDLALDFANTVDDPLGPERWDHIESYGDLLAWSVRIGTVPAGDAEALDRQAAADPHGRRSAVAHARDLREALNETFGAVVDDTGVSGPWLRLRPYAQAAVAAADVPAAGHQTWSFTELESPLWPVAAAAHRLLTATGLPRLKRCVGCPWLFLDRSKNSSRRWCSMEFCGTDEKMRRYVRKRRARS
jgi:predicted RNA-binding Zn ribbon-like protein